MSGERKSRTRLVARYDLLPPVPSFHGLDVTEGQPSAVNDSGTQLVIAGCEKSAGGTFAVVVDGTGCTRHLTGSKLPFVRRWGAMCFVDDFVVLGVGGTSGAARGTASSFSPLQCMRSMNDGTPPLRRCLGEAAPPMSARTRCTMTAVAPGFVVMYGGTSHGGSRCYGDLWALTCTAAPSCDLRSIVTHVDCRPVEVAADAAPSTPAVRSGHSMTVLRADPSKEPSSSIVTALVFGGRTVTESEGFLEQRCLGDTWRLSLDTATYTAVWTCIHDGANADSSRQTAALASPSPRYGHSASATPNGDVFIFGGYDGGHVLSDLWCFSSIRSAWRQVFVFGGVRRPLSGHGAFYFPQVHALLLGLGRRAGFEERSTATATELGASWLALPGCTLRSVTSVWICRHMNPSDAILSRFAEARAVDSLRTVQHLLQLKPATL